MAAQRASTAKAAKKAAPKQRGAVKVKKAAPAPAPAKAKAAVKAPKAAGSKVVAPAKKATVEVKPAKAVKVVSGLSKSDMERFRQLLLEKRREILGDVGSMEAEAFKSGSNLSNMPIHMADVGTDNFEQEFTLGLMENDRKMLREIQEALARIENGTFGVCLATGKPIGKVRLEAVPWAKYTMEYARALEQGKVRPDAGSRDDDEGGEEEEE